jgi:hypothetical protein
MEMSEYKERQRLTTNSPALLGLCSPVMGSGKTAFANYLVHECGFQRLPLASTLKSMVHTFLLESGVPDFDALEMISDPDLKETPLQVLNGKTPRYAMQTVGTEWGRNLFGDDLWVKSTLSKAQALMAQGQSVVIDDMRFTNEADAIRSAGGEIIRIIRAGAPKPSATHASEGELNSYHVDHQVSNDSTLECLRQNALRISRTLA